MPEARAIGLWSAIGLYALAGVIVALWLGLADFRRFDQNAANASAYI